MLCKLYVNLISSAHQKEKKNTLNTWQTAVPPAPRPLAELNGELQVQGENQSPKHRWQVTEEYTSGKPETKHQVQAAGRDAPQEKAGACEHATVNSRQDQVQTTNTEL